MPDWRGRLKRLLGRGAPPPRDQHPSSHSANAPSRQANGVIGRELGFELPLLETWNPWPALTGEGTGWNEAREQSRIDPKSKVLIAPGAGGFHMGVLVESTLAAALTLRGAAVDILLCDSALPACQATEIGGTLEDEVESAPPMPRCRKCEKRGRGLFGPMGLPVHWLSELVTDDERQTAVEVSRETEPKDMMAFRYDGLAVGEHALAGALRYYARGHLDGEPRGAMIARRYLEAAMLTVLATRRLIEQGGYDVAVFNHGIYVPQGLFGEVVRQMGVRAVTWNPAYRKHSFIFSHGDSYHHTMIDEPVSQWDAMPWGEAQRDATHAYLRSRREGSQDWIWFHNEPEESRAAIAEQVGLDLDRPVIGMFTNVMWDAQLHYQANAFPSMLHWVLDSIRWFADHPELQLAIRVHPAEMRGALPSRQPLVEEIAKAFPELPGNIKIVPPESEVSSYTLAEMCDAVTIFNTKAGIEFAAMGIPVIVAGEAWIRGKGFAMDADSPQGYRDLLSRLPLGERMSPERIDRALRYAYHFFFRRMVPLPMIRQTGEGFQFAMGLDRLDRLGPGGFHGLDVICDGVLTESPFVYPAETLGDA